MNEEENIAVGIHDDGGNGGGSTGGGGRNEEIGFKIILIDQNNDRVELTEAKIYSDLDTNDHPNNVKAVIGLILQR